MKYKYDEKKEVWTDIANELAEHNRIARLSLRKDFVNQAYRRLYRRHKDADGIEHVIQPEDKQKAEYKEELEAINEELTDHAVEKPANEKLGIEELVDN